MNSQTELVHIISVVIILGLSLLGILSIGSDTSLVGHPFSISMESEYVSVSETSVIRYLSTNEALPNEYIIVTLSIDIENDEFFLIDEVVPNGMTVLSASDNGNITATPGHIFWLVLGGTNSSNYTYELDVGSSIGVHTFSGTYGTNSINETMIMGVQNILVSTPATTTSTITHATIKGFKVKESAFY